MWPSETGLLLVRARRDYNSRLVRFHSRRCTISSRFKRQDATGVVIDNEPLGKLLVYGTVAPTASAAGFQTGCLYVNTSGTVGGLLYINTGSNTSATWLNIA